MVLPYPISKVRSVAPPPGDPGDFARQSFPNAGENVSFNLAKSTPGVLRNGSHLFNSFFLRLNSLDAHPAVRVAHVMLYDPDIYILFSLEVTSQGLLDTGTQTRCSLTFNSVENGIFDTSVSTVLNFADHVFQGTRKRNINVDASNWMWFSWYYEIGEVSSFRFYINGIVQRIGVNSSTLERAEVPDTTYSIYRLQRGPTDTATSYDYAHQWFASAADDSVIGQPEFLNEFVNADGTAKVLGNGTVLGVVPHYYFSSAVAPNVNDVDLEVWEEGSSLLGETIQTSETGEVDWLGDPARSYFFTSSGNAQFYHWTFTGHPDSTPQSIDSIFCSCFFKYTQVNNVLDAIEMDTTLSGSLSKFFFTPSAVVSIAGNARPLQRLLGTINRHFIVTRQATANVWFHICIYMDFVPATALCFLTLNGVFSTPSLPTVATSGPQDGLFLVNKGGQAESTKTSSRLSNLIVYDGQIIADNPGIAWNSSTIWESFVDSSTGAPRDIGFDGSSALGVKPYFHINARCRMGWNAETTVFGTFNVTNNNQQSDASPVRIDTISAEEDIFIPLPLLK